MLNLFWRHVLIPVLSACVVFSGGILPPMPGGLGPSGISFLGLSNRILTPNGDRLNDNAVLNFDNPRYSRLSGRVFDLQGKFVSDMAPGPSPDTQLLWDGKASGQAVPGGVYIFVVETEDRIFSGTLVVIR
jgi:gliding motility-associated-like protein